MRRTEREKPPPPQGRDEVAARATEGMLGPNPFVGLRSQDVMEQFWTIAETSAMHPQLVLAQQAELAREFIAILSGKFPNWRQTAMTSDFATPIGAATEFCKMYLQGHLAWARGVRRTRRQTWVRQKDTQRARFAVSLVTNAFAPSNMPWANPIALKQLVSPVVRACSRAWRT